jgi:hypothetical protein
MSLADGATTTARAGDTRASIVTALSLVPGLTAYSTTPDQAVAGAAWPRWVQTTYDGPLCSLARDQYDVLVTLPADYVQHTVDQGDGYRDTVAMALLAVGTVQYAEPVQINLDDQQAMPGLRLRLTTT